MITTIYVIFAARLYPFLNTKKTYMLFCEHLYVTNFFYFNIFVMWHTMAIQKYKHKLFHITYIKFTRLCLIAESINCWMPDNPDLFEQKFALSNWFETLFSFSFCDFIAAFWSYSINGSCLETDVEFGNLWCRGSMDWIVELIMVFFQLIWLQWGNLRVEFMLIRIPLSIIYIC